MVEIRAAESADVPQLAELMRQEFEYQQGFDPCLQLAPTVNWKEWAAARLQRGNAAILVAENAQILVGYMDVRVVYQGQGPNGSVLRKVARGLARPFRKSRASAIRPRRYGFIEDLYIDPSVRTTGVGVGPRLFDKGVRWFRDQGVGEFEGAISIDNHVTQKLFRKLGGEPVKVLFRRTLQRGSEDWDIE